MRIFSGFDLSVSTDSIGPSSRVTNSLQFAWDFPSFSTLVSVSQEIPQFQANQDNLAGIVLVFKSKTHVLKTSLVRGTPACLGSLLSFSKDSCCYYPRWNLRLGVTSAWNKSEPRPSGMLKYQSAQDYSAKRTLTREYSGQTCLPLQWTRRKGGSPAVVRTTLFPCKGKLTQLLQADFCPISVP